MIETISPSMNIQVSSNFERMLFDIHKELKQEKTLAKLMTDFEKTGSLKVDKDALNMVQKHFAAFAIDDKECEKTISEIYKTTGEVLDPHTAIGVLASKKFIQSSEYKGEFVVNLATAHPAKFPDAVIDACGVKPELPMFLKDLPNKKERFEILENDLEKVREFISKKV